MSLPPRVGVRSIITCTFLVAAVALILLPVAPPVTVLVAATAIAAWARSAPRPHIPSRPELVGCGEFGCPGRVSFSLDEEFEAVDAIKGARQLAELNLRDAGSRWRHAAVRSSARAAKV